MLFSKGNVLTAHIQSFSKWNQYSPENKKSNISLDPKTFRGKQIGEQEYYFSTHVFGNWWRAQKYYLGGRVTTCLRRKGRKKCIVNMQYTVYKED